MFRIEQPYEPDPSLNYYNTVIQRMHTETKYAGTKRRRDSGGSLVPMGYNSNSLTRRVNKIARAMKVHNPSHMYTAGLINVFPILATTGSLYDVMSNVQEGSNYNDRFGAKTQVRRINLKGCIRPGASSVLPALVRLTCFRAESGLSFAANMTGSYNPIQTSTSLQVYLDKYYTIAATPATVGFPVNINISIKVKHFQKFTGSAAGTTTGECIYLLCQSDIATGATAPVISGNFEVFFDPM